MADWIFDLDNTLYPANKDIFSQVSNRMRRFVADFLGVEEDEAHQIQKRYFRECGTTLRGLMTYHDLNPQAYLDYVHDIDLSMIEPNPALAEQLDRLEGRKLIFTNASDEHAKRVLDRLGMRDAFEDIFDIRQADFQPKPAPEIYQKFVRQFDLEPANCFMVEDMARNLEPAAAMGMRCLWVETPSDWAQEGSDEAYVHHRTDNLENWIAHYLEK